jgi:hypothetical protein
VRKAQYFRNKNFLLENRFGTALHQVPDWSAAQELRSKRKRDQEERAVERKAAKKAAKKKAKVQDEQEEEEEEAGSQFNSFP